MFYPGMSGISSTQAHAFYSYENEFYRSYLHVTSFFMKGEILQKAIKSLKRLEFWKG